jgi:hypothetical protein
MISALHLIWIVPLVGTIGYMTAMLMAASGRDD